MAGEDLTPPHTSMSRISELDFGVVIHDISDPEQVERLRSELHRDNPLLAKLLLDLASRADEASDTPEQAFIEGGLAVYDLILRQEQDLTLQEVLGLRAVTDEVATNDIVTT